MSPFKTSSSFNRHLTPRGTQLFFLVLIKTPKTKLGMVFFSGNSQKVKSGTLLSSLLVFFRNQIQKDFKKDQTLGLQIPSKKVLNQLKTPQSAFSEGIWSPRETYFCLKDSTLSPNLRLQQLFELLLRALRHGRSCRQTGGAGDQAPEWSAGR